MRVNPLEILKRFHQVKLWKRRFKTLVTEKYTACFLNYLR